MEAFIDLCVQTGNPFNKILDKRLFLGLGVFEDCVHPPPDRFVHRDGVGRVNGFLTIVKALNQPIHGGPPPIKAFTFKHGGGYEWSMGGSHHPIEEHLGRGTLGQKRESIVT